MRAGTYLGIDRESHTAFRTDPLHDQGQLVLGRQPLALVEPGTEADNRQVLSPHTLHGTQRSLSIVTCCFQYAIGGDREPYQPVWFGYLYSHNL